MSGKKTAALTEGQLVKLLRARYEQDNGTAAVEMRLRSLAESAESVAAQARQALDRARAIGELAEAA